MTLSAVKWEHRVRFAELTLARKCFGAALLIVTFGWGIGVGKYSWFPHSIISVLRGSASPAAGDNNPATSVVDHWAIQVGKQSLSTTSADVVMVGDSITFQGFWAGWLGDRVVLNRGINSDTTALVLSRMKTIPVSDTSVVFLLIGINDLRDSVPADVVIANIKAIAEHFRKQGCCVVLQSIIHPANSLPASWRQCSASEMHTAVDAVNSALLRLSVDGTYGHLDLNEHLAPTGQLNEAFTYDGIHLNAAGYAIWREQVREYLSTAPRD